MNVQGELERLERTLGALDHGVRLASSVLPSELVGRWAYFHAGARRWLSLATRGEPLELAHVVTGLAPAVVAWRRALFTYGVGGEQASAGFDGFISPAQTRARIERVEVEVTNLDRHIRRHKDPLGRDFVAGWERWRDSWRQFRAQFPREWDWWYFGNGAAWNETLVFQRRLARYAEAVQAAGVALSLPAPEPPPAARGSSEWLGGLGTIAVAGAVGVSVLGAVYLVSKVT